MRDTDDLDDSPPIARRRRNRERQRRNTLIALAVVGGGVVLLCVGLTLASWAGGRSVLPGAMGRPSASREGETWTHEDLLKHLKEEGIWLRVESGGAGFFETTFSNCVDVVGQYLRIDKHPTPQKAAEVSAAEAKGEAREARAWGRFVFRGDAPLVNTVLKSLTGH